MFIAFRTAFGTAITMFTAIRAGIFATANAAARTTIGKTYL